jgi:hypothetical protein
VKAARGGDLANLATLNPLDRFLVNRTRPAMQANLRDAARLLGSLYHLTAFMNGETQRLFNIHILASAAGVDHLQGMPVIGRGDHHGVDIVLAQ